MKLNNNMNHKHENIEHEHHLECAHDGCHHEHENNEHCCHNHQPSCGCGHDHENENKPNFAVLLISTAIFIFTLIVDKTHFGGKILLTLCQAMLVISTAIYGFSIFSNGVKSLIKLKFNENTLMFTASVACICMGQFSEAFLITVLYSIGEMIEHYAVDKSRSKIEELVELTGDIAYNELGERIDPKSLKVGDVFLVKPGDKVCVDAKIIQGESSFDTSNITGESLPVDKSPDDEITSGFINLTSLVMCKALCDYENSTAAKIKNYVLNAAEKKANTEKFITKFSKIYTPTIIITAIIIALLFIITGSISVSEAIKRALTFMIASCPCALVISIPLSYFGAIGAAGKMGVLIKGSKFINTLSQCDAVTTDKTGTLTKGELCVKEVNTLGENIDADKVIRYAATMEKGSSHPIAKAVCNYYKGETDNAEDIKELFGMGLVGKIGQNVICCGNKKLLKDKFIDTTDIGDAHIYVCENDAVIGSIVLSDEVRSDAKKMTQDLNNIGINDIYILSGDSNAEVESVCKSIGGISGFGSLLPTEKTDKINEIKKTHKSVIYIGDGVNDAPSLAAADFGIAVGNSNSVVLESGDATLLSGNLSSIAKTIKLAKYTMKVIYTNISFALGFKVIVLILATLGFAPVWLALIADVGVLILTILHSISILYKKFE